MIVTLICKDCPVSPARGNPLIFIVNCAEHLFVAGGANREEGMIGVLRTILEGSMRTNSAPPPPVQ